MNWILAISAILGPLTAIGYGIVHFRENKHRLQLENEHESVKIEIDEATRNQLVQDAAGVNQEREQKREDWWGEQIKKLRGELVAVERLSNRRFRRLNQLEDWAMSHMIWDRKAWAKIKEIDPEFEGPPMLPDEIIHDVQQRHNDETL